MRNCYFRHIKRKVIYKILASWLCICTSYSYVDAMQPNQQKAKMGIIGAFSYVNGRLLQEKKGCSGYAMGPTFFVELKLAHWLGIQSGLGCVKLSLVDKPSQALFGIWNASVPLLLRFYPGLKRKFCWYVGTAFRRVMGKKFYKKLDMTLQQFYQLPWGKQREYWEGLKESSFQDSEKKIHALLHLGFEYETDFGLIIGMQGLGIALGYNFVTLL